MSFCFAKFFFVIFALYYIIPSYGNDQCIDSIIHLKDILNSFESQITLKEMDLQTDIVSNMTFHINAILNDCQLDSIASSTNDEGKNCLNHVEDIKNFLDSISDNQNIMDNMETLQYLIIYMVENCEIYPKNDMINEDIQKIQNFRILEKTNGSKEDVKTQEKKTYKSSNTTISKSSISNNQSKNEQVDNESEEEISLDLAPSGDKPRLKPEKKSKSVKKSVTSSELTNDTETISLVKSKTKISNNTKQPTEKTIESTIIDSIIDSAEKEIIPEPLPYIIESLNRHNNINTTTVEMLVSLDLQDLFIDENQVSHPIKLKNFENIRNNIIDEDERNDVVYYEEQGPNSGRLIEIVSLLNDNEETNMKTIKENLRCDDIIYSMQMNHPLNPKDAIPKLKEIVRKSKISINYLEKINKMKEEKKKKQKETKSSDIKGTFLGDKSQKKKSKTNNK